MQALYIIILSISAALAVGAFLRMHQQLAPVFKLQEAPVGGLVILPAIGFLMIVFMPPPVLCAALILTGIGWWDDHRGITRRNGLVLILAAVTVGFSGLPAGAFPPLPTPLAMLVLWLCWWGFTLSAEHLPKKLINCSFTGIIVSTPLALAPLMGAAPHSLAIDVAILGSALLGAILVATPKHKTALALRLPLTFLIGYCILHAFTTGAWPFALASLVLWVVMLYWQRDQLLEPKTA